MSLPGDDNDSSPPSSFCFGFVPVSFDCEELEKYDLGGFHPVHLGDRYDGGRYKVVHKLGSGGFSTVWLARDLVEQRWVALKIILANDSLSVEARAVLSHRIISQCSSGNDETYVTHTRYFYIHGPNGWHLCLVLPVLGPSASRLSSYRQSRLQPWLARRVAYQTAKALAQLHTLNLCHGGEKSRPDCAALLSCC
jgi:serine/threonine-protein kinase SRPK3